MSDFIKMCAAAVIGITVPSAFVDYDDAKQVPLAVAIPVFIIGLAILIVFGVILFSWLASIIR